MHSTALSDLVLALATLFFVAPLLLTQSNHARLAAISLFFVALAAILGVTYWQFNREVETIYKLSSAFAGRVAIPMLAICIIALSRNRFTQLGYYILALIILFVGFEFIIESKIYGLAIGALAMVAILINGIYLTKKQKATGLLFIVGSFLTIIAGLVIGTRGELLGYLRIDLFHYILAIANTCLGFAVYRLTVIDLNKS